MWVRFYTAPAPRGIRGWRSKVETYYQREIAKMPIAQGVDPRHVEGYMRLQYSTLSHLSRSEFAREVRISVACIREGGTEAAERNAQSFGL